jgi:hypothetical protein
VRPLARPPRILYICVHIGSLSPTLPFHSPVISMSEQAEQPAIEEVEPPRKRPRTITRVIAEGWFSDMRKLIMYLPYNLPDPSISIYNFGPITTDKLELHSDIPSCVVERLEKELGSLSRNSNRRLQLKERGAGASAAVDFLEKYYQKYPSSIEIQSWIEGLKEFSKAELDDSDSNDLGITVSLHASQITLAGCLMMMSS